MDYKKLCLKCGIEIHQQLNTRKLFCNCSSDMREKVLDKIERKQHPVPSELGKLDITAQFEYLRDRKFVYQTFPTESCLIEYDEEPPMPVNKEALEIVLEIALLLNCKIPDEIHVMRKTIIDGSNTTAFQRTMVIGLNGKIEGPSGKKVEISHVSLEEDSCGIVEKGGKKVTYRLNRLAIPLVEIGTDLLVGFTPEKVQDIAYRIGMLLRSTGKIKRGIGSIRQDVNVSIKKGARVEIKGVQELGLISKVIEKEVERQLSVKKPKEETRVANPDGTTRYTRPLPGAERMYVETDIPPIVVDKKLLEKIKKHLPETWGKKLERFEEFKLSDELLNQIVRSEYSGLFEKITKKYKVEPSVVANVFVNTLKDLEKREKIDVHRLEDNDFLELFGLLEKGEIVKESIPDLLTYRVKNPDVSINEAVEKLGLLISKEELRKIVKDIISKNKGKPKGKIIGLVMSQVRGKVKAKDVIEIVEEEIE